MKNTEDMATVCDLCGAPRPKQAGPVDPRRVSLSLISLLRAGPEEFDRELQESRRVESLKRVKGVFGVPLRHSAPRVLCDCMAYITAHGMQVEGIFRIPGHQDTVDALRAMYEKNEAANVLGDMKCEPHDVATLFKTYFRMLPEPLLPVSHYDHLMESVRMEHKTKDDMIAAVMDVLNTVPSPQRECLGLIIHFLKKVSNHSDANKMTPANLATCFAPSLLRAPEGSSAQQALMDMSAAIGALNILIKDHHQLAMPSAEEIAKNTKYHIPVLAPPPGFSMGAPPGMGSPPGMGAPPGMQAKSPQHLSGAPVPPTPPVAPPRKTDRASTKAEPPI